MGRTVWYVGLLLAACSSSCSRSNNLLLGRVEETVGTHNVVVTDCYRTSVPPPSQLSANPPAFRFTPCRDADVLIRGAELVVNDHSYGPLQEHDGVLVDHGKVSVVRSVLRAGP